MNRTHIMAARQAAAKPYGGFPGRTHVCIACQICLPDTLSTSAAPNTADAWTSKYFKCLGVTVELPFTDLIDQVMCECQCLHVHMSMASCAYVCDTMLPVSAACRCLASARTHLVMGQGQRRLITRLLSDVNRRQQDCNYIPLKKSSVDTRLQVDWHTGW